MLTYPIDPLGYPCDDCNAEPNEPCRPYCTGEAAHQEKQASTRGNKKLSGNA